MTDEKLRETGGEEIQGCRQYERVMLSLMLSLMLRGKVVGRRTERRKSAQTKEKGDGAL